MYTEFWKKLSSFPRVNKECGQPLLEEGNVLNVGQQNPHISVCRISVRTSIAITQVWRILLTDSFHLYYHCLLLGDHASYVQFYAWLQSGLQILTCCSQIRLNSYYGYSGFAMVRKFPTKYNFKNCLYINE
jgi:hypothetical protein